MPPLTCCATEHNYFDDDLFIFIEKDMHSKTYKGLIVYLQTQNYKTIMYFKIAESSVFIFSKLFD